MGLHRVELAAIKCRDTMRKVRGIVSLSGVWLLVGAFARQAREPAIR